MRKHLKWPKELEVGLKEIDNQHKKLFKLVNKLLSDCLNENKCNCIKTKSDLLEIYSFAKLHFETEEKIMRDYNYTDYEGHCKKHREIFASLEQIKLSMENDKSGTELYSQFSCEVVEWFSKQTMNEDLKLAEFLREKIGPHKTLKDKLKKYFPS